VTQLHRQTLVPLHHIEALETGCLENLPEDVYVRGFITRLAHALGLNGMAIASSIPQPDPVKSVVPSWYHSTATSVSGFQLSSVHLYLGYTALIAGAVGGLSWMSSQSTPGVSVKPQPGNSPQSSASPKAERKQETSKPGLKASKTGLKVGADIAPPEALPF
jgi:cytoskeletal protein RodZ